MFGSIVFVVLTLISLASFGLKIKEWLAGSDSTTSCGRRAKMSRAKAKLLAEPSAKDIKTRLAGRRALPFMHPGTILDSYDPAAEPSQIM